MENKDESISNKKAFIEEFKQRTKQYVLRSIRVFQALPKTEEARIIGRQFLRASSSVGANYRAACRARSKAEFYAKLSITIEEADESLFWMEVMAEAEIMPHKKLENLIQEGTQIVKVLSRARKNT